MLKKISDHDYELEGRGCWIKAGNVLLLITHTDSQTSVSAFWHGKESEGTLKQMKVSQFEKGARE